MIVRRIFSIVLVLALIINIIPVSAFANALGRVTREEYFENESETASRTVTYTYNETGNLSKMTDSKTGTTTTYSYDPLGRLLSYTETGREETHVVRYGYDEYGRLTTSAESHGEQRFSTYHVYDSQGRITTTLTGQSASTLLYDDFNRITFRQVGYQTNSQAVVVLNESIDYRNTMNKTTSNQVSQITINSASYNAEYHYGYDANGNIISVSDGVNTTSYVYDGVNQLIRENNQQEGKTWTWTYDTAGNITSKQEYSYTTGELGPVMDVIDYNYGNESWGDLLTSYDGQAIIYDTIGNPLVHGTRNYTWTEGRRLSKLAEGENTWEFSYDGRGMRTERSNGAIVYSYVYDGGQLKKMTCGDLGMYFFYDASGYPISIMFNGSYYYLVQNLQGDVVAILDHNGVQVVGYSYDAWGVILSTTGSMSSTLGVYNPFRYRSYIFMTAKQVCITFNLATMTPSLDGLLAVITLFPLGKECWAIICSPIATITP